MNFSFSFTGFAFNAKSFAIAIILFSLFFSTALLDGMVKVFCLYSNNCYWKLVWLVQDVIRGYTGINTHSMSCALEISSGGDLGENKWNLFLQPRRTSFSLRQCLKTLYTKSLRSMILPYPQLLNSKGIKHYTRHQQRRKLEKCFMNKNWIRFS